MILVRLGDKIPLSLMLYADDNDKVVKANLITFYPRDEWVSEILLVSRGDGIYDNTDYAMPADVTYVRAYYDVFEGDGITSAGYYRSEEIFALEKTNPQFVNKITTTFNPLTDVQEVLAWVEKDGQRLTAVTDCVITVKNSAGTTVWTATDAAPNADGIFKVENSSTVVTADSNYYVIIVITAEGVARTSIQSFITVG